MRHRQRIYAVYGDIDVNCTFSSLVSEKRDELFDELNKLLFN